MLCYKCLHQVPDDSEICPFCGQKLKIKVKKDTTPPPSKQGDETAFQGDVTMVLKPSERTELPVAREFQIGDTIIDRFEVREVLAQEGLFYSYKVRDKKEKKTKVLKLLSASFIEERVISRFNELLNRVKNLSHKSLPQIYEILDIDGLPFFTMEYLEGLNLRKLLSVRAETGQHFTVQEADPIITPLMDVIEYIHSQKMIHGDLKPENVLILPDTIKITDTGIYKLLDPREFISLQLALGDAYYYLSPEFITQHSEVSPRADIYSIGVILYEMFTGVIPKGEQKPLKEFNPDLPDALDELIKKALQENPEGRIPNINTLKRYWYPLVGREPPEEVTSPPSEAPAPSISETLDEVLAKQEVSEADLRKEEVVEKSAPQIVPTPPPVDETATKREAPPQKESKIAEPPAVLKEEELLGEKEEELREDIPEKKVKKEEVFEIQQEVSQPIELEEGVIAERKKRAAQEPTKVIPFPVKPVGEVKKRSVLPIVVVGLVIGAIALGGIFIWRSTRKVEELVSEPPITKKEVQVARPAVKVPVVVTPKEPEKSVEEQPEKPVSLKKPEEKIEKQTGESKKKTEEPKRPQKEVPQKVAAAKPPPPPPEKPKCPDGMVYIPAGNFIRGSSGDDPLKDPLDLDLGKVYVEEFCIDIYEYPNHKGSLPLSRVNFKEADSLCRKENKRLCTENEWEKACKGPKFYKFPYGNEWNANACNTEDGAGNDRRLSASGSFQRCRSDYGVMDMSGNLREWTDTRFSATVNDIVVKGGSYTKPDWASRCAVRYNMSPTAKDDETGFRCCSSPIK